MRVARRGEGAGGCDGGPWAALTTHHASPLWTLQRLCFEPDLAADPSDRGENRDPGTATEEDKRLLTKEVRLENAPFRSKRNHQVRCGAFPGADMCPASDAAAYAPDALAPCA